MGMPIKGFFDGEDVVAKAVASASTAAAQGAPAEALVPLFETILAEESTQAKRAISGESASILIEIPTPQKEVTPIGTSQTGSASPSTPLFISASDPFITLS